MEDVNFITAAQSKVYDPGVALEFFKSAGTPESVAQGKSFFTENEKPGGMFSKGAKMFLLLEGEVNLVVGSKVMATFDKHSVFGEMATLAHLPRSATAVAKTDCRVLSLDEKQFRRAIEKTPGFALMLMNIIITRLRHTIALFTSGRASSESKNVGQGRVFEKKVLSDLVAEYDNHPPLYAPMHKVIMTEGEMGAFMYVILEGQVNVSIRDRAVERIGPGGVFGEMALIDQAPRVGTVTAQTDCSLLAIGRRDFLTFVQTKPDFSLFLIKALSERLRYMNSLFT